MGRQVKATGPNASSGSARSFYVVMGVVGALALGTFGFSQVRSGSRAPVEPERVEENLGAELRRLKAEVRQLKTSGRRSSPPEVKAAAPAAARAQDVEQPVEPPEAADDPELADFRAEEQMRAQTELLDETWRGEAVDPEWSPQAAMDLSQALQREELDGLSAEVDCRASLCRIDMSFADAEGIEGLSRLASRNFPWPGMAFFHLRPDDQAGVYYLARENFELPVLASGR